MPPTPGGVKARPRERPPLWWDRVLIGNVGTVQKPRP